MPETARHLNRRSLLAAGAALALPARAGDDALAALRAGGVVLALRHAQAPGSFDPPNFRLGDCSTQRNLDDSGRAQARRIGHWFAQQGLKPTRVRSSPWCRCMDTATLAFGAAGAWAALGSPRGFAESTNEQHLGELRQALLARSRQESFEVWVTHMFVLQALVGQGTASGEGLVLRPDAQGSVQVLARLAAG
ncbi:phosphohistidine phosphatase SixA [Burkholderiales bacterium JOSHI_001]|nr:phosphohistidine phosphatase SixA [Burkholderiales bacterium JOSHI_001]